MRTFTSAKTLIIKIHSGCKLEIFNSHALIWFVLKPALISLNFHNPLKL